MVADIVRSKSDLEQILHLQQENLRQNISIREKEEQGFVTLEHSMEMLQTMHQIAPSIVIRDKETVVAYALTELKECRKIVPDLEPMFLILDAQSWEGRLLKDLQYYVMGQICIDKSFRGKGLVEKLYHHHRQIYQSQFELLVTEISTSNFRSLRAHEKIGFKVIHQHQDEIDTWVIVGWKW